MSRTDGDCMATTMAFTAELLNLNKYTSLLFSGIIKKA